MEFSTLLQIIPILGLVMYMFYMTYFYAFPMFILKILLFYGHVRYRGSFGTCPWTSAMNSVTCFARSGKGAP